MFCPAVRLMLLPAMAVVAVSPITLLALTLMSRPAFRVTVLPPRLVPMAVVLSWLVRSWVELELKKPELLVRMANAVLLDCWPSVRLMSRLAMAVRLPWASTVAALALMSLPALKVMLPDVLAVLDVLDVLAVLDGLARVAVITVPMSRLVASFR